MNPALPKHSIVICNDIEGLDVVAGFMGKNLFKEGRAG